MTQDDLYALNPGIRQALYHANAIVFEQCLQDLIEVEACRDKVTDGFLFNAGYLPRSEAYRYDPAFLRCFSRALAVVAWKLDQQLIPSIGSVAEGLAAHALLREAELFAEEQGLGLDLEPVWYLLFAGTTILTLFDLASDGGTAIDGNLASSLGYDDWFVPFNGETAHLTFPILIEGDIHFEEN